MKKVGLAFFIIFQLALKKAKPAGVLVFGTFIYLFVVCKLIDAKQLADKQYDIKYIDLEKWERKGHYIIKPYVKGHRD